jgi:RNA polymerase sigma-70 factor (ECF subfamily)
VRTELAVFDVPEAARSARGCEVTARPELAALYAEHIGFVYRVLRGMGVPASLVADAAQDVFVVVHRRLAAYDPRGPITTWLFAIAYRVARNYRRSLKRARVSEPIDEQLRDAGPSPGEVAERREAERLVSRVLDELDEQKRLLLVLVEIEQLSVPEVAGMLGKPLNTVYTQLRRARLQFERALAAQRKRSVR